MLLGSNYILDGDVDARILYFAAVVAITDLAAFASCIKIYYLCAVVHRYGFHCVYRTHKAVDVKGLKIDDK